MRSSSSPAADLHASPGVHTSGVALAGFDAADPFAAGRTRDAASPGRVCTDVLPAVLSPSHS